METTWLKSEFWEREYIADCPQPKRMKFSEVSAELHAHFPEQTYSSYEVSRLIHETFPNTESKACGKSRLKHILGLERIPPQPSNSTLMASQHSTSQPESHTTNETSSYSDLLIENQQLKARIRELERTSATTLCCQADRVISLKSALTQGPTSFDSFQEFNLDAIITQLQSYAPDLYHLYMTLGDTARNQKKDEVTTEKVKAVASMCSTMNARSARMKGLQLLVSMMLVARATSKQAITVLSHAGMCMSYTSTWTYLLKLTQDAQYTEQVQSGHWIWVYDNLNLHQAVRHEREAKHSSMLNVTARLAVRIENLPDWDVDWNDITPQRSRSSLTCDDFLPSIDDATALNAMATQYTMEFLVEEFDCLHDLKPHVPCHQSPHPTRSPNVAPMAILFKDEKYKAETVEIIRELMADAKLSGNPQVVVGDQLTCKNIRAMKAWTQTEVEPRHRLQWAHEVPGDFHFLWECLRVVFTIFWGTPSETGTLCQMREFIARKRVSKNVKVFNVGDEFLLNTFKAHLIARTCSIFGIASPSDDIQHTSSLQWLEEKAKFIVSKTIQPTDSKDPMYMRHRSFLHLAFLYVDLRRAIRWRDGAHIIRHWKLWLPRFVGTGCKNYSTEAINLIAHLEADFPRHIAYIATHNRTVSTTGKPGSGKPIDQLMEHYVLVVKQALRSSGANVTEKHIRDVSMCALFLLEAAKKCDAVFKVTKKSTAHTVRDANADIAKLRHLLLEKKIATEDTERMGPAIEDPTASGVETITKGDWLQKQLTSNNLQIEQSSRGETDMDYELDND